MRWVIVVLVLPVLLCAQEFQFRQEFDTIPVEINGWRPFVPWLGGLGGIANSIPEFCDIDADSDLDLFCGDGNTSLIYFENVGTSAAAYFHFESYQFESFNPAPYLSFADIDHDGDQDALYGYRCYYNVGSATQYSFTSSYDSLFDTGGNLLICPRMATVDINSDGDIDIFAGQYYTGQIRFYENIGSPTQYQFQLTSAAWLGIAVSGGCADPTFCDIDADGDLDLFVGNEYGCIYFYRNDGDSVNYNFTYVTDFYDSMDVGEKASPEFADIDGDGDYDLFVGRDNYSTTYDPGDLFYYENIGSPGVAQWILRTKNYLSLDEGASANNCGTDIDADGAHDIFLMNMGDHLSYFENIGDSFQAAFRFRTGAYQNISVNDGSSLFADIDGDQDPDLFIGEALIPNPPYPGLYLFQNVGTPQSASLSLYSNNYLPYLFDVAIIPVLADIDADGDKDLFIRDCDFGGNFYYLENVGSPTVPQFASPVANWQGLSLPGSHWSCFYDIDDDGDLDYFITVANWSNDDFVGFYLNTGTPQVPNFVFQTNTFLQLEGGKFVLEGIDIVDIDHDGDGDFFLGTSFSGGMLFFRNITGEASAPPPVLRHPRAGLQISLGPNPANPLTVIRCQLPVASNISLEVFDISGRKLVELASGFHLPGEYRYVWDASGRAAGMYVVRLKTGRETVGEKLVILK